MDGLKEESRREEENMQDNVNFELALSVVLELKKR